MTTGERVKNFRESKGISQEKLARELNFSLSLIAQIERNKIKPSRNFIQRVKKLYPEIDTNIFFSEK
jgi:DNA-binding helix-turn-helix protein